MYVGAKKPSDRITIKGSPNVNVLFENGVAGDEATVAMLLATVPAMKKLDPGVRSMLDVPVTHYRSGE
jgi:hypothetical protein